MDNNRMILSSSLQQIDGIMNPLRGAKFFVVIAAGALVMLLLWPAIVEACPGCAGSINGSLGRGLNTSIIFMMAMPFTLVGAVALGIVLMFRHAKSKHSTQKTEPNTRLKTEEESP